MSIKSDECKKFEPFRYKTLNDLREKLKDLNIDMQFEKNVEYCKQPLTIGHLIVPNRLSIQPMEGFDATETGSPTKLTERRYLRYATGGAGLIWFEATALDHNCKSNPHQLVLTNNNLDEYRVLISKIKKQSLKTINNLGFSERCVLILQLNHSGRYVKRNGVKYPIRAFHDSKLDRAIGISKEDGILISDKELEELEDLWVKKALLAKEAGFDGVDIKACHGYLISELFCSRKRENSVNGGESLENRTRIYFNIIKKLSEKLEKSKKFIITTRLGIYNGRPYPYGFGIEESDKATFPAKINLREPLKIIKKLSQLGIKLINLSAGNPHYKPQITRPYDIPVKGKNQPNEHPLCSLKRLFEITTEIKESFDPHIKIIGSGYSYLRQHSPYICSYLLKKKHVDICGFGRMSFANPNFPQQVFQNGKIDEKKVCITCSKCSELMRMGKSTGCVIRDSMYKNKL
ncbi:MAG: flavin oxidoreductase/NADH oxidase [Candidatus Lokiarchaeota archaeon]|nr:flavin oxidoreductase/NADH oxidase [Candidatus Lokiarchaeota archaeon]MBD3201698.1 flavin oxidoreductase/NADH oxidase [Candidatus Lokiarchaeota archaeon]